MKKIFIYLLISVIFTLMYRTNEILSQKAILDQYNGNDNAVNTDSGLGLFGLGRLGNFGFGNFGIGTSSSMTGMCPDDKPLLLTNGVCVPCNHDAQIQDILLGCEKCKHTKNECMFEIESNANKPLKTKQEIQKTKHETQNEGMNVQIKHKYELINLKGVDNRVRATLQDTATGQKKIISVGDTIDGQVVVLISLDNGIIVEKNGIVKKLDVNM